ncbi:MAG: hypothetical protein DMF60_17765, partial [Acidobacteria bacterium]
LAVLLSSPVSMAQHGVKKKAATAAPGGASSRVEPLRVIGGELYASTVTGQVKQGAIATDFSFTITKAEIVNDRLQLSGDFALGGSRAQMRDHVTATIGGVISNAANPWPSAREERRSEAKKAKEQEKKAGEQQQGREARTTPPAPGEKTEQTQSLYAQSETSTRCGVLFLKLTLSRRLRARIGAAAEPLQLGVVLKPFDNERGEGIVKQVCLLLQNSESRNQSASLHQLNRLLIWSK